MLTGDTILKEPKSNVIVTHASCMEIGEEGTNKKRMMMEMMKVTISRVSLTLYNIVF